jgi:hypothetical protein
MTRWKHTSSHGYNADTAALKYISAQNCVHANFYGNGDKSLHRKQTV